MENLARQIADSIALGGKVVFFNEDEISGLCPLFDSRGLDSNLPAVKLSEVSFQKVESICVEKDWIVVSAKYFQQKSYPWQRLNASILVVEDVPNSMARPLSENSHDGINIFSVDKDDALGLGFWSKISHAFERIESVVQPKNSEKAPCLFLDRDDVVIKDVPYATDPSKVELVPGIVELINEAHEKGYWVALVTNQSGLGRGRIDWVQYQQVHQRMLKLLAAQGAFFDDYQFAGYIGTTDLEYGQILASLRKPGTGMFHRVHEKLKLNKADSIMVGDSASDLMAAYNFGVRNCYLLRTEKSDAQLKKLEQFKALNPEFAYQFIQGHSTRILKS